MTPCFCHQGTKFCRIRWPGEVLSILLPPIRVRSVSAVRLGLCRSNRGSSSLGWSQFRRAGDIFVVRIVDVVVLDKLSFTDLPSIPIDNLSIRLQHLLALDLVEVGPKLTSFARGRIRLASLSWDSAYK
jgi:hypothetical protein